MQKIYMITDRGLTISDSVSRYIIDIAKGLSEAGFNVTIFTTHESRISIDDSDITRSVEIIHGLPESSADAIFHFHLTFSIRKHTQFLLDNIKEIAKKSIVIFHTDTKYAKAMGLGDNIPIVLNPLIEYGVIGYVYSNYSKANLSQHGFKKIYVIYPGLNLDIYDQYEVGEKENLALFISSNPDNRFIEEIKGLYLLDQIQSHMRGIHIIQKANISFAEYISTLSKCKYYLALGEYEHYGFSIIDAFNLGCIPIFRSAGGLIESVQSRGFPFFVHDRKIISQNNYVYDLSLAASNYTYTKSAHSLQNHIRQLKYLYAMVN